jgi:hypothetical protein
LSLLFMTRYITQVYPLERAPGLFPFAPIFESGRILILAID